MRPIHLARLDKVRPALVLTRELVRPHLNQVTVAVITTTIRGLSTEVELSTRNGLAQRCVVNLDLVQTIPVADLGEQIGWFYPDQEEALSEALRLAYDLK